MICKRCGANFEGNFCPNCGAKYGIMQKEQIERQKTVNKQLNMATTRSCLSLFAIIFGLAVIIVVGINILAYSGNDNDKTANYKPASAIHLIAYSKQLSSGHYVVGMDIPEGTYTITATKGSGNVYSSGGNINEIMGTGKNDVKSFKNAELTAGDILSVRGVKVSIKSDAADTQGMKKRDNPATKSKTLTPGNYTDIPIGTYDVKAMENGGNVYSEGSSRGINAIMGTDSNDMYEKDFKGLLIEEGTTLAVKGVTIRITPSK